MLVVEIEVETIVMVVVVVVVVNDVGFNTKNNNGDN